MTVRARRTRARERRCETERAGGGRRSAFGGGFRADGRPARVLRDEGRRGVAKATLPVARPASAYFSQRARSLSRRAINTASLGGAPGPNALPPSSSRRTPFFSSPYLAEPFHRRRSAVSLRATPRARYRRPSQTNSLRVATSSPFFLSRDSLFSVYLRVFPTVVLYLYPTLLPLPNRAPALR